MFLRIFLHVLDRLSAPYSNLSTPSNIEMPWKIAVWFFDTFADKLGKCMNLKMFEVEPIVGFWLTFRLPSVFDCRFSECI